MKSIHFWQKWLLIVTILVILFGILLMIPNDSELFNWLFNNRIEAIFWPDNPVTPGVIQFQHWLYGVLGATMIGWGTTMAFIIAVPYRQGEKWAWHTLIFGLGSWYILDTAVSIIYGATFNAVFNTIILLLFLPPLIATYVLPHNHQPVSTISS